MDDTRTDRPTLVVGIGASAGGLDAFKQLLPLLPSQAGMAFLLVQHLDPTHKSLLPELLAPCTPMPVNEAHNGVTVQPDSVYVIGPGTALSVHQGQLVLSEPTLHRGVRLPVDHLFHSLAHEYGPRSVGIVLTGAGSDGSSGLRDIKAAGGMTVAQDPESSGQTGMPQSAIDTGAVDLILSIAEMPDALVRFAALPPMPVEVPDDPESGESPPQLGAVDESVLTRLAALLQAQADFDIRVYKSATLKRRVHRRMTLSGYEDPDAYFERLRESDRERQTLVRDLLISVTDFFRDPRAFHALREQVIDPLVAEASPGDTLRAWVPGCATGEEAYSIGMEFLDSMDAANKRLSLQIFATDVDCDALSIARAGIYPSTIADRVSERRLNTYFKPLEGKGYQVRGPLRDSVSFAVHDLTKDPPFSRMNLVSCRNVLIYLRGEIQQHVLNILHFALLPDGVLFLSTSESTGGQRDLFSTLSKTWRLYRKRGASHPISIVRSRNRPPTTHRNAAAAAKTAEGEPRTAERGERHDVARKAVLRAMVAPAVIVSEEGSVLFMHGDLRPYLRFPEGENPRMEFSELIAPELANRARGAIYKSRREHTTVKAISSPDSGIDEQVEITASPVPEMGHGAVVVTFAHVQRDDQDTPSPPDSPVQENIIQQLEQELQATREDLRNTVEELETSNEELRSSNEESMSMNEELQSANEELEATSEELRSLNEELTTVNAQLREKIDQLEVAHDDLANFFSSTKIATVFLDDQLRIKHFTPAAQRLLSIGASDVGRSVGDIARELLQSDLENESRKVLDHLSAKSRELHLADGRWIIRNILPYRTESQRIEGVVVTFADVTALKSAVEESESKSRRLDLAWEVAQGGIFEHAVPLDKDTYVSEQWAQVFGCRVEDVPRDQRFLEWLFARVHADERALLKQELERFFAGTAERFQAEARLRHADGGWVWVRWIERVLERDTRGHVRRLMGMMIDITDLKAVAESLRESEMRFREMTDGLPLIVWAHEAAGELDMVNETYCQFFGVERADMKGGTWQMLLHPEDADAYIHEFKQCIQQRRAFHAEARVRRADGEWRRLESWGRPRFGMSGEYRGYLGTSADITDRERAEAALRESEDRFRTLADNISQLAWMADGNGWIFWYNRRWYDYTGTTLEEMQGWGWKKVHHPDHLQRVVDKVSGCFENGETWEDTFPLRGADGHYCWFLSRALPIHDEQGRVVRWFGTNTDITQQLEVERRLKEADRRKNDFLAMLSHELRNPLSTIRNVAELLRLAQADDDRITKAQAILERQSAHVSKLLDSLLDVTRITRGKLSLSVKDVDLVRLLRDLVADHADEAQAKGIPLREEYRLKSLHMRADPARLIQVFDNLLTNALRFSDSGQTITVRVGEQQQTAIVAVEDQGQGFDSELREHLFEPFQQGVQDISRADGGLGLGLSLARGLVELHKGSIHAESAGPGKGATFIVRLPVVTESEPKTSSSERNRQTKPRTILIIEDNEDSAVTLRDVLTLQGHRVQVVLNGAQGIGWAREHHPDVILCDIGLPEGLSGFDVALALRGDARTSDIALIALTGYGRPEDKRKCEQVGFDAHLTKPVDISTIQGVMAQAEKRAAARIVVN